MPRWPRCWRIPAARPRGWSLASWCREATPSEMIWLAGEERRGMAFPPLSQGPFGLPQPQGEDPPGYYYGWPLARVVKRLGSAFIDYVLVWFALLILIGLIGRGAATAQGGKIGSVTAFWLFVVAYAAQFWNFIVRQGRSGQSFGKQLMGTRLVTTSNLAAPGKAACGARNLALLVDVGFFGIGILSIAFSQRRTSFGDRLAGTVVIDERRAGATIAWAVPNAPSHTRGMPEPHGAVPGWQPPAAWRRWLASLRSPPPPASPQRSGIIDAEPPDESLPPVPALPTLDDDEEAPTRPGAPADALPRPEDHVPPDGAPGDRSGEERGLDPHDAQASIHPYLAARLGRLAARRGVPLPGHFLTEDVVGALEAGDLDEAFLFAGRQARRHLRETPPEPTARREAAAELAGDFERLARLLEADTGLSTSQIRRRLGRRRRGGSLTGAWVWAASGRDGQRLPGPGSGAHRRGAGSRPLSPGRRDGSPPAGGAARLRRAREPGDRSRRLAAAAGSQRRARSRRRCR